MKKLIHLLLLPVIMMNLVACSNNVSSISQAIQNTTPVIINAKVSSSAQKPSILPSDIANQIISVSPASKVSASQSLQPTKTTTSATPKLITPATIVTDRTKAGTATCNDGSLSYSSNHRGTCSHHGGVASWLE